MPGRFTPLIGGHFRVRHDTIDADGKLTLRHNSRLDVPGQDVGDAGRRLLI